MSANAPAEVVARSRPPVVDYAIYALIARCVFSLLAAFALYAARDEVTRSLADANRSKNWSAETLHHNVDTLLRGNLVSTLVMVVLVAILIKFIRDGRNWSRWVYLFFSVLITRDLFQVFGFFQYDSLLARVCTGLVGLSAIAALVLLFLPESNAFFRPATGAPGGLFAGLFRPRPNVRGTGSRPGQVDRPGADKPIGQTSTAPDAELPVQGEPVHDQTAPDATAPDEAAPDATDPDEAAPAATAAQDAVPGTPGSRQAPRGKSRQPGRPHRPADPR